MAKRTAFQLDFFRADSSAISTTRHRWVLDGMPIEYTLKRSRRRRSISLTVDENGLRVGAPWRASDERIQSVLRSHGAWILRKLHEWETRRPRPMIWQPGATLMVIGEPLTLDVDPMHGVTRRDGSRLYVDVAADDPEKVAGQVVNWLRTNAQNWFEQRAAHFADILKVRRPSIHLSNAKTRWGTCHPDGRVHLSWRLIQAPSPLIDYVVVHELAHLREPNHSPRFWGWVASVLPDYRDRRRMLRYDSHRYLVA